MVRVIFLFFLLISIKGVTQEFSKKSFEISYGKVVRFAKVQDVNNYIMPGITLQTPIAFYILKDKNKFLLRYGIEYINLKQSEKNFIPPDKNLQLPRPFQFAPSINGSIAIGKTFIKKQKSITPIIGYSLGFNGWAIYDDTSFNDAINEVSFTHNDGLENLVDGYYFNSNMRIKNLGYHRINIQVKFDFKLNENRYLFVQPYFAQGLNLIYERKYFYTAHQTSTYGTALLSTKGSFLGVSMGLGWKAKPKVHP